MDSFFSLFSRFSNNATYSSGSSPEASDFAEDRNVETSPAPQTQVTKINSELTNSGQLLLQREAALSAKRKIKEEAEKEEEADVERQLPAKRAKVVSTKRTETASEEVMSSLNQLCAPRAREQFRVRALSQFKEHCSIKNRNNFTQKEIEAMLDKVARMLLSPNQGIRKSACDVMEYLLIKSKFLSVEDKQKYFHCSTDEECSQFVNRLAKLMEAGFSIEKLTYITEADIKIRIFCGKNVNIKLMDGETLLGVACSEGWGETARTLLRLGAYTRDEKYFLHMAARDGYAKVVEALVKGGVGVNAAANGGFTPLHEAALGGHVEVVEMLLAAGANVNARADNGVTPLHEAACSGHAAVVKVLTEAGADVSAETENNNTPLSEAWVGHAEVVKTFTETEAAANARVSNDHASLDEACAGHVAVIEMLIKAEADANASRQQ